MPLEGKFDRECDGSTTTEIDLKPAQTGTVLVHNTGKCLIGVDVFDSVTAFEAGRDEQVGFTGEISTLKVVCTKNMQGCCRGTWQLTKLGKFSGKINRPCKVFTRLYWSASPATPGFITVENVGDCPMTMVVTRAGGEEVRLALQNGERRTVGGNLLSLFVNCRGDKGCCRGTWEFSDTID